MAHLADYQWQKEPDVWSQALWLGAALRVLKAAAETSVVPSVDGEDVAETARAWLPEIPVEVKAMWPGIFDEYPYAGESAEDHAARRFASR
jgi:hypothetical protein